MSGLLNMVFGKPTSNIGLVRSNGYFTPATRKGFEGITFNNGFVPVFDNSDNLTGFSKAGMGGIETVGVQDAIGMTGTNAAGIPVTFGTDPTQATSGFSLGGVLSGLTGLAQGAGGLLNAYTGLKSLEMAKDQFGFQKALANRNLANQAKIINNTYDNAAIVSADLIGGGMDSSGRLRDTDTTTRNRVIQEGKKKHVDGSPI